MPSDSYEQLVHDARQQWLSDDYESALSSFRRAVQMAPFDERLAVEAASYLGMRFEIDEAVGLLLERGASKILTCTLLDKPSRRQVECQADFVGFTIEDVFIVGYGIDYAEGYRHLPYIGVVG